MKTLNRILARLSRKGRSHLSESLVVQLSPHEKNSIVFYALKQGIHPSTWVRQILLERVPDEVRKAVENGEERSKVEAYASLLSESEEWDPPEKPSTKPAQNPLQKELDEAPRDPSHSCVYLRLVYIRHLKAGECQGTCAHPEAPGRICSWPSGVAHQCTDFEPKPLRLRERLRGRRDGS